MQKPVLGNNTQPHTCWLCAGTNVSLVRKSSLPVVEDPATLVQITDASYGVTADIFRCADCGFLQCSDYKAVLKSYESMSDPRYEETRNERALQARQILSRIPIVPGQRLLDIGAGSGILVAEAIKFGLRAEGIEPSFWLQSKAVELGLPVKRGVLPNPEVTGSFDIVTLIDVIEHVPDPIALLRDSVSLLAPGGRGIVVTPDVGSLTARLLGSRWWHYRPAHIGYFDRSTLVRALDICGLVPARIERARWVLPADYLWERVMHYAPQPLRLAPPALLKGRKVALNLFDSLLVVFKKK